MRRARGGFAGYVAAVPDGRLRRRMQPVPGFLGGEAGIVLALASAVSDNEATRDRMLLLSFPGSR
jgi:hypothetical protein